MNDEYGRHELKVKFFGSAGMLAFPNPPYTGGRKASKELE